jgi:acyl transferase domain-containing protein
VFVGLSSLDYQHHVLSRPPEELDGYSATGNMASVAAGRIAYTLGLQGPCVAVDTACSSSLVAIHLACQSLRDGESQLALAGGVNLLLSRTWMVAAQDVRRGREWVRARRGVRHDRAQAAVRRAPRWGPHLGAAARLGHQP